MSDQHKNRGGALGRFENLYPLSQIDALLASPDGLTIAAAMVATGLSDDTIRRYLEGIEKLFCGLEGHPSGPWRYAAVGATMSGEPFRLFSEDASEKLLKATA